MTTSGAVVHTILAADPVVAGLVDDRIYPMSAVQGAAFPFVVYQRVGGTPYYCLENGDAGLFRDVVQVVGWDLTYTGAQELGEAVERAMRAQRGTYAALFVSGIVRLDYSDEYRDPVAGDEKGRHGARSDFSIHLQL